MERTSETCYPFVKCLNPQIVYNKYLKERMVVGCGKCEACLSKKSAMSTLKCRLESKEHQFSRFVTLTYSNDYIPRMRIIKDVNLVEVEPHGRLICPKDRYVFMNVTPRLDDGRERVLSSIDDYSSYKMIADKVECSDLPYLSKRDLQLFIKRFRRYYDRYYKKLGIPCPLLRYYACGEMGPVHFRPHYHLIFWFDSPLQASMCEEAVSACWKFGRVSTEIPRDDVSKYVAKYVNGNCRLPSVYKQPQIRPFSLHSQHLGESVFQTTKEEIYRRPVKDIITRCCIINDSLTDVNMWRSLTSYYFPRCKGYHLFSTSERLYAYTLAEKAIGIYEKLPSLADYARRILCDLFSLPFFDGVTRSEYYHSHPYLNRFYKYFIEECDINPLNLDDNEYYDYAFRAVYMDLRLSKHFQEFVCDNNPNNYLKMLNKIEQFYNDRELLQLNSKYQDLEDFATDWFENDEEYVFAFEAVPDAIKKTKLYKRFYANSKNNYEYSMKHKKLNDLNKVFDNI